MRGKHTVIICFSVFLCLVAGFWAIRENAWSKPHSISAEVRSDGRVEEVKLWMSPSETYYLFVPGYADLSQVHIRRHVSGGLYLDDRKVTDAMVCSDFPLEEPLTLIHDGYFSDQWNKLTIVQSADVATMYIDVKSGTMDYIHGEKGNKESGTMRLYTAEGKLEAEAMVDSLQGRGNSTWQWREKKPYSLDLSSEEDLLGMGAASRWILLANSFDLSNIKNKMAYELAGNAGMPYTPDCQWVDLYLNGEYAGLYLLSERNEIHPNRVDIPAESSFLVAWESEHRMIEQGYPYVKTDRGTAIRIHHSAFDLEKVRRIWQSAENAIFAEDGIDPVTGKHYLELIDLDSWAKLYLMDEIPADHDGGRISKFFYYQETDGAGKIYAGPVWDKDSSLITGHWSILPPNCIVASRSDLVNGQEMRIFHGLSRKEEFSSRVTELYESLFRPLLQELYDTGIAQYADRIAQAARVSELRWQYGYSEEESRIIRNFLGERMAFLDAYWLRKETFCQVRMYDAYDGSSGEFAIRPGEQIPCIPEHKSNTEPLEWYLYGTDEPFDITQPIWEDVALVLKTAG